MVMGNALWHLIKQSDAVSQLVLLVLLGMSILCWAVFFYKVILLRTKKRQLHEAITHMKNVYTLEQLLEAIPLFGNTIAGYFLSRNLAFLKAMLESRKEGEVSGLTPGSWELVEQNIQQSLDDMVHHEESYVPFLSMSAAVSPLLGLFGTVWGLVHAFVRISEKQSADIATVAPGIAEALITTLAGLMIAIPAVVMFSYITTNIRALEQQLVTLADRFSFVVHKQLLSHDGILRPLDRAFVDKQATRSSHATF